MHTNAGTHVEDLAEIRAFREVARGSQDGHPQTEDNLRFTLQISWGWAARDSKESHPSLCQIQGFSLLHHRRTSQARLTMSISANDLVSL
jgi:hypothetical protein